MTRVRCRNCNEWVVYVVTATRGRPIPCNPEFVRLNFVPDREATEADREATWRHTVVVMLDGQLVRGYAIPSPRPPSVKIVGRISHFTTCPQANYYREQSAKRRAARRADSGGSDAPR
jgi:hypothetical protein